MANAQFGLVDTGIRIPIFPESCFSVLKKDHPELSVLRWIRDRLPSNYHVQRTSNLFKIDIADDFPKSLIVQVAFCTYQIPNMSVPREVEDHHALGVVACPNDDDNYFQLHVWAQGSSYAFVHAIEQLLERDNRNRIETDEAIVRRNEEVRVPDPKTDLHVLPIRSVNAEQGTASNPTTDTERSNLSLDQKAAEAKRMLEKVHFYPSKDFDDSRNTAFVPTYRTDRICTWEGYRSVSLAYGGPWDRQTDTETIVRRSERTASNQTGDDQEEDKRMGGSVSVGQKPQQRLSRH
jgi:hypothetical protein